MPLTERITFPSRYRTKHVREWMDQIARRSLDDVYRLQRSAVQISARCVLRPELIAAVRATVAVGYVSATLPLRVWIALVPRCVRGTTILKS